MASIALVVGILLDLLGRDLTDRAGHVTLRERAVSRDDDLLELDGLMPHRDVRGDGLARGHRNAVDDHRRVADGGRTNPVLPGAMPVMRVAALRVGVTVCCVPSSVTRTPWIGWLLSTPVMVPEIRPVRPVCRARLAGRTSAQADSRLTVMSRRFMVGDAPKRVEPAR